MRKGFKVTSGHYGVELPVDSTERISDDLSVAKHVGATSWLYLREWVDIQPWAEFRCFMVDRKIAGISQYDYIEGKRYPELERLSEEIERSIRAWFPKFRDACHLDDVVFDVIFPEAPDGKMGDDKIGNDKIGEPVLLEINPDVRDGMTDPCLFRKADLDGAFRFIGDGREYPFVRPWRDDESFDDLLVDVVKS